MHNHCGGGRRKFKGGEQHSDRALHCRRPGCCQIHSRRVSPQQSVFLGVLYEDAVGFANDIEAGKVEEGRRGLKNAQLSLLEWMGANDWWQDACLGGGTFNEEIDEEEPRVFQTVRLEEFATEGD